ncbi:MAG: hypothetical protein GY714_06785 [Desulfobacterales bacterium]|nr:hypothetical protein [Desulfobacterales bacterium]
MEELKRTIIALASPAREQIKLYPEFVCIGDELVLDFDEAYKEIKEPAFNPEQKGALEELDQFLESHAGPEFEEMYLERDSLFKDMRWVKIRNLAHRVIEAMGWNYENPVGPDAVYLGKKNKNIRE